VELAPVGVVPLEAIPMTASTKTAAQTAPITMSGERFAVTSPLLIVVAQGR
jgi:hypothetical protein